MLIGIIADIHANVYALEAIMSQLRKCKPDLIMCAGDIVGYYPFVNETIDLLKAENVLCILGNHDAALIGNIVVHEIRWHQYSLDYTSRVIRQDNLDWLCKLPDKLHLALEGLRVEVYHGSPWFPLSEYIYPDHKHFERFGDLAADYVILGHTHWPMLQKIKEVTVVNPGSCGQPRDYNPGACYAVLDTQERQVSFHRVAYDIQQVTDVLLALKFDPKLIDILYRQEETAKC